eukprot:TRINITY_DN30156_c0_g2_i1.p1 TRINITY_DN30156_c0_g2~~TRINITY_DN30156_c0_g2_i1.p1  ORF type:complete len:1295 (+),score=233.08 TRINITY_DN30156_c0_g2_i1:148-4032(+)
MRDESKVHREACKGDVDCEMGHWGAWSSCSDGAKQKYRQRSVVKEREGSGHACNGTMEETAECVQSSGDKCEVGLWSSWELCDRPCGGGTQTRSRVVLNAGDPGGQACSQMSLQDMRPCNLQDCEESRDCEISDWADWGDCSAECGSGLQRRTRSVLQEAREDGRGCTADLEEVKSCFLKLCADDVDCRWSGWSSWSACSASCGGGTKQRDRYVATAPAGRGNLCEAVDKEEIVPCNTESCDSSCIDGSFLDWSVWSSCSATCGEGFQSRSREVGSTPNHCGKPVSGLTTDYRTCDTRVACEHPQDCELRPWSDWSSCSSTCSGMQERTRVIERFAREGGKSCESMSLKDVKPCSSDKCGTPTPEDCKLGEWGEWEPCSRTCDGGQQSRSRSVLTPAELGGHACEAVLMETQGCGNHTCDATYPIDCVWGTWSDWSICAKCGDQRYQNRKIVQMPNALGRKCDLGDASQTDFCQSQCDVEYFCAWSEWSKFSPCSAECGPSSRTRVRSLQIHHAKKERSGASARPASYLFQAGSDMICGGHQQDMAKCAARPCEQKCTPESGTLTEWSEWSTASCTQLCERSRVVAKEATCGGIEATGPLTETKKCPYHCNLPQDCILSDWLAWTPCSSPTSQRQRSRSIVRVPLNGGKPCEGSLQQVAACGSTTRSAPCDFDVWAAWSSCSVTCGEGFRLRQRDIKQASLHGGAGCLGAMREAEKCVVEKPCNADVNCELGNWGAWSTCDGAQQFRQRIVVVEASGAGAPCNDDLKAIRPCNISRDCEVTEWSLWDDCDKSCDGGQRQRQRQITKHPIGDGKRCPDILMQTEGCNTMPCGPKEECEVSDWGEWSSCSAMCGTAQKSRTRFLTTQADCKTHLEEVADCGLPPCKTVDCVWHDWAEWSSCSCKCGGGQRSRDRMLKQTPSKGGLPCNLTDKEQVEPCNTQKCNSAPCIDGEWGQWSEWEQCSSTCRGGLTWRNRPIEREANYCGQPVSGMGRETASCNEDQPCADTSPCTFADWSDWSECSKECDGMQHRSRVVSQHARGGGEQCEGDLKQSQSCNLQDDSTRCNHFAKRDCVLGDWADWSICTAHCDGGQRTRMRSIVQTPVNGGKACDGPLEEAAACNTVSCQRCTPQDCVWGDWEEWGSCTKCAGQKRRHRSVISHAQCGGKACESEDSEETHACDRQCHSRSTCMWSTWGEWGKCDKTCGQGTRLRERRLFSHADGEFLRDATGLAASDLAGLRRQTADLEAKRSQELIVAFACGGVSIFIAFFILKVTTAARAARQQNDGMRTLAASSVE